MTAISKTLAGVFVGVLMLMFAVLLIVNPSDDIYMLLIVVLTLRLAISGIKDIIFYFTMARHIVDGKMILVQGVIVLDFAILTGLMYSAIMRILTAFRKTAFMVIR